MIIPFSLRADTNPVIVTVPPNNARIEIDNALVYIRAKSSKEVLYLNVGDASVDPERILEQSGFTRQYWSANLAHPLDVDDFSPKFAAAFVCHYGVVAYRKIRRHPRIAALFDRADCNLVIKDYDFLSEDIQQELVYRLRRTFPIRLRRLIINQHDTAKIHQQQRFAHTLIVTLSILYGVAFALGGAMLVNSIGVTTWQDGMSILALSLLALTSGACFFGGANFGTLLAALVLRCFTPKASLKMVLLNSGFLSKATINRLTTDMEMDWLND